MIKIFHPKNTVFCPPKWLNIKCISKKHYALCMRYYILYQRMIMRRIVGNYNICTLHMLSTWIFDSDMHDALCVMQNYIFSLLVSGWIMFSQVLFHWQINGILTTHLASGSSFNNPWSALHEEFFIMHYILHMEYNVYHISTVVTPLPSVYWHINVV